MVQAASDIKNPFLSGFTQLAIIIGFLWLVFYIISGYVAPIWGGVFAWKFRTVLIVIWLVSELAYKMGS